MTKKEANERAGVFDASGQYSRQKSVSIGIRLNFPGGMRQRIVITVHWQISRCVPDEPTTALDVTIQAQVLELIQK